MVVSVKRTHNHCSSIRQIFHHKLQRRLAAQFEGLPLNPDDWPNAIAKSTRAIIEMRYTDAIPDFRYLEEAIDWVGINLVSLYKSGILGEVGPAQTISDHHKRVFVELIVSYEIMKVNWGS
jgi:hypothetical protein